MKCLGKDWYAKSKWKYGDTVAFVADREASGRDWKPTDQTQTVAKIEAGRDVANALGVIVGSPVYERARLVKDAGLPTSKASHRGPDPRTGRTKWRAPGPLPCKALSRTP